MSCNDPNCAICAAVRVFENARDAGVPIEVVINDTIATIGLVYGVDVVAGQMTEIDAETLH